MSEKFKIYDREMSYFITMTVVDWIDVFTKSAYKKVIIESLEYCQKNKGLEIYGWCLMPNHLHMIAKCVGRDSLSEVLRDFKKYTSRVITQMIRELPESRKEWMLDRFEQNGRRLKRIEKYKFWQDGNHAEIISRPALFYQKLRYIHNNPVKQLIVSKPEEYYCSSARNYAGLDYLLEIVQEVPQLITY
jgi:REP element-mobilizing transposase RayT